MYTFCTIMPGIFQDFAIAAVGRVYLRIMRRSLEHGEVVAYEDRLGA